MTRPYRLHYAPDNASLCVRLALEEIGCAYGTTLVDRRTNAQKSASYLRLNPNGLIPVLETPQGVMFETAAILLWLSEAHSWGAPDRAGPERTSFLTWLFWLSNTLHPAMRMMFYPSAYAPDTADNLRQATQDRLPDLLATLNAADCDWLDRPSILSCYLAPMLRWMALFPAGQTAWFDLGQTPRLKSVAEMMDARASTRAACAAEGLGATPFSNPSPANPPEGSAL